MKRNIIWGFIVFCISILQVTAQESEADFHKRMKWWDDCKLGMFLHWGVYSAYGGEYNGQDHGKEMGQASAEWIYLKANIPQEEYQKAALRFYAENYNPKEWVKMAQDAGMGYMVLTSKHHDGFALFNSKASAWNANEKSGAKRDLIKEYVDACHEAGMRVGFYYSHEKDWTHHAKMSRDREPLTSAYKTFVWQQVTELFTNYGQIDLIWFDTPVAEHKEFNRECASLVRKLQPNCIINGRIGNELGDYKNIGDRAIVDPGLEGYMESIMTMRVNWGYDENDDYWKSSEELIKMVSRSACRGSNFLLNIGPKPDGTFPVEDQVRLAKLGEWMHKNGEAIYKTNGSPFAKEHKWGSITRSKEQNVVYLHLWNWNGGDILLKGLTSEISKAVFLASGNSISYSNVSQSVVKLNLPENNAQNGLEIIKLELRDKPQFNLKEGPEFEGQKVDYVTTRLIEGELIEQNGINFTLRGKHVVGTPIENFETLEEKEKTISFSLNDGVKYRINKKGDIQKVNGFALEKQQIYKIVYSPFKSGNEVEIICKML